MQKTHSASIQNDGEVRTVWSGFKHHCRSPKVLVGLALSTGPILYFAKNLMQVLVVLLVLAIFIPSWSSLRVKLWPWVRDNWIVFIFVAVGFLSVFWSLDAGRSLERALRLVWEFSLGLALIGGFAALEDGRRRLIIDSCAKGLSFTAIFVTFYLGVDRLLGDDHFSRAALNEMAKGFSRGAAIHAILAVPLGFALWQQNKRSAGALVVLSAMSAAGVILKLSPGLALAVSLITFCAVYLAPWSRYAFYTVQIGLVIFIPLLLPLPAQNELICDLAQEKLSAAHRIVVWNFADEKIYERPLLGWGLNTSRLTPGHDGRVNLADLCPKLSVADQRKSLSLVAMPSHPHNVPLQIWLEMGALGVAAATLLLGFIIRQAQIAFPARAQLAVFTATFSAAYSILFVSFSLFQGWLMASLFFVAALLSLCMKSTQTP